MNERLGRAAPGWLAIAAGLGLVWNLFGCYAYLQSVGAVPGGDPAMSAGMPTWVTAAFAVAVFGGALGCFGLLLRKQWGKWLLFVSLLCVLAMDVWTFLLRGSGDTPQGGELGLTAAVALIAILLAWLAYDADRKGYLS